MRNLAKLAVSTLAVTALAMSLASTPNTATASGAAPVVVTNTPLPVTGSLNATVAGAVNATLTGPVSLASGSTVKVGNSQAEPIPVQDVAAAKQPVHGSAGCSVSTTGSCHMDLFTVPAGQRLVIEHISGNVGFSPLTVGVGTIVVGRAFGTCCTDETHDYLAPHQVGQGSFAYNHHTLMFFNAGETVRVQIGADTNPVQGGGGNATFAGYLIPQ